MGKLAQLIIKYILFIGIVCVTLTCNTEDNTLNIDDRSYVIVLSLDGFRWDYPVMYNTPALEYMASIGVKADWLIPVFPSFSFTNHYSIVTGYYPDNHGIVHNNFYDPLEDRYFRTFDATTAQDGSFYGGEPLWVTAEKAGVSSATLFWHGSEAEINGFRPGRWKKYDASISFEDRIDTIVSWLQLPLDTRPQLIFCYIDEPDDIGHSTGPFSNETKQVVEAIDDLVGDFIAKLKNLPIYKNINLIVLSDHGMTNVSSERTIFLNEFIPDEWMELVTGFTPVYSIKAVEGYKDSILNTVSDVPNLNAWTTDDIPERLIFGKNPRTLDILMLADSSWSLSWDYNRVYSGGNHGYDNSNSDMFGIFYAFGPAFKTNFRHFAFSSVEIYNLVTAILKLDAGPNDGNFENVRDMFIHH